MRRTEIFESYTNLAYNLAGLAALIFQEDLLFCMALQALGAGSFIYHFHKTKPIYLFDWWAMTFVITILTGRIADTEWVWYAVIAYQVVYSYLIVGRFNVFLEVGIAVAPCLLAVSIMRPWWVFVVVGSIFLVSLLVRSFDEDPKQLKFHDSIFHGLWHIGTAAGFYVAAYLQ